MIAAAIAAVIFVIAVWEAWFARHSLRNVSVRVRFREPAVTEGGEIHLTETIENRKRLPLFVFEVAFRTQKGLIFPGDENITESDYIYKRDVFSLLGMERIIRSYRLLGAKRGHYTISQAEYQAVSIPLYRRMSMEMTDTDDIYVYAKKTDIRGILEPLLVILGESESRRRYVEDPFVFSTIREYMPGDPPKHINWKATAKTGDLMVNTFGSSSSERIRIYLDVEDRNIRKQVKLTEDAISCAATLCRWIMKRGIAVSICANGKTQDGTPFVLANATGRNQQRAIEQYLTTDFEKSGTTDFPDLIRSCPPDGEIPIIISKNESEELYAEARKLADGGASCIFVVPTEKREVPQFRSSGSLRVLGREAG